jgi:polysaccharide biosynthesis transport protein
VSGDNYDTQEFDGGSLIAQIPVIIWQRKWLFIIPLLLCLIAAIAAYFILPTVYQSKAVLLVQSPLLPQDVAGEGANDVVDRRIARIRQQVLSRPGLIELINKHELYKSFRERKPLSETIEAMRDAIDISVMTADVQQSGANKSATIAVNLSYDYSDPKKAQGVAQDLTSKILDIDASVNSEQASSTKQFLADQSEGLAAQISELESRIAGIKAANGSVLSNSGMGMFGGSSGSYDVQISALQRENAQLNTQRDQASKSDDRDPIVSQAEAQLAALRAVYSDDHPDVVTAKQRLREAKLLAKQNVTKLPLDSINQQIAFNNAQIAQLRAAQAGDSARISSAMNAQSRGPVVLQEIAALQQKLDGLNAQYQNVSGKLLAAQAGVKAEDQQMGERLTVVDPPVIPDTPTSPNILLLGGGGLGAGLALGLLMVFGMELFMQPIRGPAALTNLLGEAPMVVIPTVKPHDDISAKPRSWWPFGRKQST